MPIFAFATMKKGLFNITREGVRGVLRQALSPTFLIILLGATLSWYASKLSSEYTTEIPFGIRIDGQKYRLTAVVSGRGSVILAQRMSLKHKLRFTLDELSARDSRTTLGASTISRPSLQNAINGKISGDIRIVQVTEAPEFVPHVVEAEKPSAAEDRDNGSGDKDETPRERRKRERTERREARKAAKAAAKTDPEEAGIENGTQ